MEFKQINTDHSGSIELFIEDKKAGEINYIWENDQTIAVTHTGVNPQYEGQGLGKELVLKIAQYAQSNHLKIIPICPFVGVVLHRIPEYKELIIR
jgi:hypothetical protein